MRFTAALLLLIFAILSASAAGTGAARSEMSRAPTVDLLPY